MPGLDFAQDIPCAANAQVFHGHLKARAQVVHVQNDAQAFSSHIREMIRIADHKNGIGLALGAAHAAAQLVKLPQAEHVGLVHNKGVGHGKIQAGFDNGRAHQDIDFPAPEFVHGFFQGLFIHLAVANANARVRGQFAYGVHHPFNALHPVVHPKNLTAPGQFPFNNGTQGRFVLVDERCGHGLAFRRRGFNDRKLADAGNGQLQRARNGRGRQGKHVQIMAQFLEFVFVTHAEALFFIQNKQA